MRKYLLGATAATAILGSAGYALLKGSEGVRYKAYPDLGGVWTICYGHTGPEVVPGMTATQAKCNTLLDQDIKKHLAGVKRCTIVPLTQNQQDAVVIFAFNVGVTNYCNSTMARKINKGDFAGAAEEFPKWNKVRIKGVATPNKGLSNRRRCEQRLFTYAGGFGDPNTQTYKVVLAQCPLS